MNSLLEDARHFRFFDLCKNIPMVMYHKNGGQLRDWKNPFGLEDDRIEDVIFYQEGFSCKDESKRTFWFDPKWEKYCPFEVEKYD